MKKTRNHDCACDVCQGVPPVARRPFVGAVIGALLVAILYNVSPVAAQITGAGSIALIQAWDGTNRINVGDNANSAIRVNIVAGAGSGGTASSFTSAFPATGTAAGFSDGTNMQGARVVDMDTGGGTVYGLIGNLVRRASGGPVEMIGQATMANSLPVVLSSDQSAVPVSGSVTSLPTTVASANNDGACSSVTTTSAALLASFGSRKFVSICSRASNTDAVFVKLGATATTSDFPLEIGQCFTIQGPIMYTGTVDSRSNTGTQSVCFFEL